MPLNAVVEQAELRIRQVDLLLEPSEAKPVVDHAGEDRLVGAEPARRRAEHFQHHVKCLQQRTRRAHVQPGANNRKRLRNLSPSPCSFIPSIIPWNRLPIQCGRCSL